ncbi:MAG: hypothetical protein HC902_12190 [Calothrix sp. SM1_5_4]|nr:hypothetical protein [Calothrix sp. SM1_5_4]
MFFLLFVASLSAGILISNAGRFRDAYRSVCDLTELYFYKHDAVLESWLRECRRRAGTLSVWASEGEILRGIQDLMSAMNVSHFTVYSPVEDRKLWKGESRDTGIRSRYVEDHLIVYRVLKGSAAERAGVRPGDEILSLPGTEQVTPWGASHRAGVYEFRRAGKEIKIPIEPAEIIIDSSPSIEKVDRDTALLAISSFRSEYFAEDTWRETAANLMKFTHVIVDVRENAGGNFVAMLRALSTFLCADQTVGAIVQPRKAGPVKEAFDDDLRDLHQIAELGRHHSMGLRTFSGYGCYRGKVTVLISAETASVAEIFAQSFFYRPGSRVWGQPSAGDVVLAVWYDLPILGAGYSISIPQAVYRTPDKKELEGLGVYPQRELYHQLELSLQGKDSWVVEAAQF